MKNIYKKHCDLFIKSAKTTRVCWQRVKGNYYITDGITLLTVPAVLYDNYIRPLNAIFIPLQDGETAIKNSTASFTEIVEGGFNIKKTLEMHIDTDEQVNITSLLYATKKTKFSALFKLANMYTPMIIDLLKPQPNISAMEALNPAAVCIQR